MKKLVFANNKVKEARENMGFTQQQLATMLGIHRITIVNIEKGKKGYLPSLIMMAKIARALGKPIEFFIEEIEEEES